MKIYKRITYVTVAITVVSATICLWLHYTNNETEAEFWINISLALFGSAALTLLTSLLTYFHERQKTLENFLYHTRQILSSINRYQENMSLEEKLRFYLDYHDMDKTMWDSDFGNIDFFLECVTHNKEYIFQNIYTPILEFGSAVDNHVWHFRWHLDGSGKNERVMKQFIAELETFLIKKTQFDMPTEWDENDVPTAFCKCTDLEPRLVLNVKKHLAGRYYEIMYGKIKVAKLHKMEAQMQDGQTESRKLERINKIAVGICKKLAYVIGKVKERLGGMVVLKKHIYNWKSWLIGSIIFLVSIHILFSIPAPFKWLEAVWDAGDLISLIGTLILGCITVKQADEANKRAEAANEISHRLMNLEFERYKLENRPFAMVADWKAENLQLSQIYNPDKLYIQIDSCNESKPILGLSLFIQNTTNAPISVEFKDGCMGEHRFMYSVANQPKHKLMMQPFDIQEIVFYASEDAILKFKGKISKMNFILENRFAERYQESFKIIVTSIDNLAALPAKKWFCSLFVQDFEIGKFVKNEVGEITLVMEDL